MVEDTREPASTESHKPARPLKFFKDKSGIGRGTHSGYLIVSYLRAQGCWRCDEMAFPTGGR